MAPERPKSIDYDVLIKRALRGMLRDILTDAAATGLPAGHQFYLSFRTGDPGVELSDSMRAQYPEEITVVLQEKFWDGLKVDPGAFSVTLQFAGVPTRVRVPFGSLTRFADPSAQFALELGPAAPAETPPTPEAPEPGAGNVVAFPRKRRQES